MPDYEYRCRECGQRSTIYQSYEDYGEVAVECPQCGSQDLERIISRVRLTRSEDTRMDALADPSMLANLDEDDPKSLARAMRSMSDEMGEEMPEEFDEVIGRLEAGESPEDIEKSMPDLGAGDEDFGL